MITVTTSRATTTLITTTTTSTTTTTATTMSTTTTATKEPQYNFQSQHRFETMKIFIYVQLRNTQTKRG